MLYAYEDGPRVSYDCGDEFGDAQFVRVCPNCGRYVKATDSLAFEHSFGGDYRFPEPTGTCAKCGPVFMPFEGWF